MKTITTIFKKIDDILTIWSKNYIDKVTRTLYPKPYLEDDEDEDDENPILFI